MKTVTIAYRWAAADLKLSDSEFAEEVRFLTAKLFELKIFRQSVEAG